MRIRGEFYDLKKERVFREKRFFSLTERLCGEKCLRCFPGVESCPQGEVKALNNFTSKVSY